MDTAELVYKNEKTLFVIHCTIATIFWLALIAGTFGVALIFLLFFFISYLFAQSAHIAWIKGNGVKVTADQLPDLYNTYLECCKKLGMTSYPDAYVINGNGVLNAFATKFLGHKFVVLYSNVLDSMKDKPESLNFYIGHELGHIQRKHLQWHTYLLPSTILPLVGTAYYRACEYTCDQFGRACCLDSETAVRGLATLAAGQTQWPKISIPAYLEQDKETSGYWMSLHELLADYPWLVKRAARINDPSYVAPKRHGMAWVLALFIPRFGYGAGAGGAMIMVAIIGILAAIALPAYQDYTMRAKLAEALIIGNQASAYVGNYYETNHALPADLTDAGIKSPLPASIKDISLNSSNGIVTIMMATGPIKDKSVLLVPSEDSNHHVIWSCSSQDILAKYLPEKCKSK